MPFVFDKFIVDVLIDQATPPAIKIINEYVQVDATDSPSEGGLINVAFYYDGGLGNVYQFVLDWIGDYQTDDPTLIEFNPATPNAGRPPENAQGNNIHEVENQGKYWKGTATARMPTGQTAPITTYTGQVRLGPASGGFFASVVFFQQGQLIVRDKHSGARSGEDYRTVTIGFYYDGGIGVDAADGYNVDWLGVTSGGTKRGLFGGEPVPSVHDFNPASPHAGTPGLDANGNLPPGAIEIAGKRYWVGSFQATVPSGQVEETTYHGELQLTIS